MVAHTCMLVVASVALHELGQAPRVTVILMVWKQYAKMLSTQSADFVIIGLSALQPSCIPEVRSIPHIPWKCADEHCCQESKDRSRYASWLFDEGFQIRNRNLPTIEGKWRGRRVFIDCKGSSVESQVM